MTLRDFVKNSLFYCSEIMLDAATPGQVAKERLVRNAKLHKEACECLCESMHWSADVLMKEMWKEHRGSQSQAKAQEQGKKTVAGHPLKPAGVRLTAQPRRTVKAP